MSKWLEAHSKNVASKNASPSLQMSNRSAVVSGDVHNASLAELLNSIDSNFNCNGPPTLEESARLPLLVRQKASAESMDGKASFSASFANRKTAKGKRSAPTRRAENARKKSYSMPPSSSLTCVACTALAASQSTDCATDLFQTPVSSHAILSTNDQVRNLNGLIGEASGLAKSVSSKANGSVESARLMRCAEHLRRLSLPRFAEWISNANQTNLPQTTDSLTQIDERNLAILFFIFNAAGKQVVLQNDSVLLPTTIGHATTLEEEFHRKALDDLLFLDKNSCFAESQNVSAKEAINTVVDCKTLTLETLQKSLIWKLLKEIVEKRSGDVNTTAISIANLHYSCPRVWRSLQIHFDQLDEKTLARIAYIFDNKMISLVEFAMSGVLFTEQHLVDAVQQCYEKICAFGQSVQSAVLKSSSPELYEVFWFSSTVVQFESRMKLLLEIESRCSASDGQSISNEPLFRFRASMQRCAKKHSLPIVQFIDQLCELKERNMLSDIDSMLQEDWIIWKKEQEPVLEMEKALGCPYDSTINWLRKNTGLTEAQHEMASMNTVALQKRLQLALDDNGQPVHDEMVRQQLAVDDKDLARKHTPLPILVCYDRSLPANTNCDIDLAPVTVNCNGTPRFRAYGVFLYTQAPCGSSASRYALMMWLSQPYSGEIVLAFTPFCQGFIDCFVSNSERTSAPGFNGLQYYSMSQKKFVPISNILPPKRPTDGSTLGVYNRISSVTALEMRRNASLREVKEQKAPQHEKNRDTNYFRYKVEGSDQQHEVHPAVIADIYKEGFEGAIRALQSSQSVPFSAIEQIKKQKEQAKNQFLQQERDESLARLGTWRQNFFNS